MNISNVLIQAVLVVNVEGDGQLPVAAMPSHMNSTPHRPTQRNPPPQDQSASVAVQL